MHINCVVDSLNDTNGYIISDLYTRGTIIIDPCDSDLINAYIQDKHLTNELIILTHEHYDHIAGLNNLRFLYNSPVIANITCSKYIQSPIKNMARYYDILLTFRKNKFNLENLRIPEINKNYKCSKADIEFEILYNFNWHNHEFALYKTPGHSDGSCCILVDNKYLFSGDSLLKDYQVIFGFPGGSKDAFYKQTLPFFLTLNWDTIVYPGHGRTFILRDVLDMLK
jgi:glyoxylase-like metal-dependent hydrolase (beta-lactamase superfamily II)